MTPPLHAEDLGEADERGQRVVKVGIHKDLLDVAAADSTADQPHDGPVVTQQGGFWICLSCVGPPELTYARGVTRPKTRAKGKAGHAIAEGNGCIVSILSSGLDQSLGCVALTAPIVLQRRVGRKRSVGGKVRLLLRYSWRTIFLCCHTNVVAAVAYLRYGTVLSTCSLLSTSLLAVEQLDHAQGINVNHLFGSPG